MTLIFPYGELRSPAEARNTRQRRIIKATMEELGDFISAQDLYLTLANRKEQVSSRNHSSCVAAAMLTPVSLTSVGRALRVRPCTATRRVKDHHHSALPPMAPRAVAPAPRGSALAMGKQHGFSELEHVVEVTGYCPDCTLACREEESLGGAAR